MGCVGTPVDAGRGDVRAVGLAVLDKPLCVDCAQSRPWKQGVCRKCWLRQAEEIRNGLIDEAELVHLKRRLPPEPKK